jgi:predicted nucleic acid-binding protein
LRPFDALIAATVLTGGHTLVTRNIKHFRFIAGLTIIKPDYA